MSNWRRNRTFFDVVQLGKFEKCKKFHNKIFFRRGYHISKPSFLLFLEKKSFQWILVVDSEYDLVNVFFVFTMTQIYYRLIIIFFLKKKTSASNRLNCSLVGWNHCSFTLIWCYQRHGYFFEASLQIHQSNNSSKVHKILLHRVMLLFKLNVNLSSDPSLFLWAISETHKNRITVAMFIASNIPFHN